MSRRDPSVLSNGKKKESATEDPSSEQDNSKPKATRNILLIRHSQYNLSGNSDKERILTPLGVLLQSIFKLKVTQHTLPRMWFLNERFVPVSSLCPPTYSCHAPESAAIVRTTIVSPFLGREQAEFTGQRLAALGLRYDVLIHSSMARATETANIISKHLPGSEGYVARPTTFSLSEMNITNTLFFLLFLCFLSPLPYIIWVQEWSWWAVTCWERVHPLNRSHLSLTGSLMLWWEKPSPLSGLYAG